MDSMNKIKIRKKCNCSIDISLRHIIEIGLKPTINEIMVTIASTLVNNSLFKRYELDSLFVLEDAFDFPQDSFIYKAHSKLLQDGIELAIESKEKDTQVVVFQERPHQFTLPIVHKKSFLYDSFITGTYTQVSRNTYGIRILNKLKYGLLCPILSCEDYEKGNTVLLTEKDAIVLLEKNQPLPIKGVIKKLKLRLTKKVNLDIFGKEMFIGKIGIKVTKVVNVNNITAISSEILKLNDTNVKVSEGITPGNAVYDSVFHFSVCSGDLHNLTFCLETKYNNYNNTLSFGLRAVGEGRNYENWKRLEDPLSIALL